jgi:carbamoyltransferase
VLVFSSILPLIGQGYGDHVSKKNYIGLSITPHDPAICILSPEGEILFAQASERYLQNKRAWHSPADDLFFVRKLIETYCDPKNELVISLSWEKKYLKKNQNFMRFIDRGPIHALFKKFLLDKKPVVASFFHELKSIWTGFNEHAGSNLAYQYYDLTKQAVSFRYFDHHLTHAAAACYNSTYEEAACAIIDGNGQDSAINFYHYASGKLKKLTSHSSRSGSLGLFYWCICKACGFNPMAGEEWKVMGLAAYGKLNTEYYDLLKNCFKIDGLDIKVSRNSFNTLKKCLKMARDPATPAIEYADFAYTGQRVFAEYVSQLLCNLHDICPSEHLVLGGGCALNSSYVGLIQTQTPFKKSYVFSAPADDGNAVGAALLGFYQDHPHQQRKTIQLPYLGSTMSERAINHLKKFSGLNIQSEHTMDEIIQQTAKLLSEGKIIGWVQGRAEFGPRALGNRSIIADPRRAEIKNRLNEYVKFREEFRPFAPSILHEFGNEYFEDYQESPYMERTLLFKQAVRDKVPGVVHVDGTGRLQTVKREWNASYYDLIKAFYEMTGVPLILNTSFNVMGKPIIHGVEDALAVFFTSGLDALVIENHLIVK